jgi:hypothetical protein
MGSNTFTINLGNIQISIKRRQAWERQAKKENCRTLGEWLKKHGDQVSGFSEEKA